MTQKRPSGVFQSCCINYRLDFIDTKSIVGSRSWLHRVTHHLSRNGTSGFGCVMYGYCTSEQKSDSRNLTSNSICLQFTEVTLHNLSPLTAATRDTAKSLRHFNLKLNLTKTGESACSIWTLAVSQMSPTSYLWKRKRGGKHNATTAWLSFHLIFFQESFFC